MKTEGQIDVEDKEIFDGFVDGIVQKLTGICDGELSVISHVIHEQLGSSARNFSKLSVVREKVLSEAKFEEEQKRTKMDAEKSARRDDHMKRIGLLREILMLHDNDKIKAEWIGDGDLADQDTDNLEMILKSQRDWKKMIQDRNDDEQREIDKRNWFELLYDNHVPMIGKLCSHFYANGCGTVERMTKKVCGRWGYKVVESWWDEYRGPSIEF